MHHVAVAENEPEANGGELYQEESSDEGDEANGGELYQVRQLLPPRPGCRIERHRCKKEGQQQWQVRFGKILGYVRVGGYV